MKQADEQRRSQMQSELDAVRSKIAVAASPQRPSMGGGAMGGGGGKTSMMSAALGSVTLKTGVLLARRGMGAFHFRHSVANVSYYPR